VVGSSVSVIARFPRAHPHDDRNDDGNLVMLAGSFGPRANHHARTSATSSDTALHRHGEKPHGRRATDEVRTRSGAGRWRRKAEAGSPGAWQHRAARVAAGMC